METSIVPLVSRVTARRSVLVVLAALALTLPAAAAEAKTYCVQDPACPAGGIDRPSLLNAVDGPGGSDADPDADVIRVGPGVFTIPGLSATEAADIVGAGIGRTEIRGNIGISVSTAESSVSDFSVVLTADGAGATGVRLNDGSDATRVKVSSQSDAFTGNDGFVAEEAGSVLTSVQTDLPPAPVGSAASFFMGGTITDSTIVGGIGVSGSDTTVHVARSTIRASVPLRAFGSSISARNSVLAAHPRSPDTFSAAIQVTNGNDSSPGTFSGDHLTVVGPGSGSGLVVDSNSGPATGNSTATLLNSIIRNVNTSIRRDGDAPNELANATVAYSSYNGGTVVNDGTHGTVTQGAGNITNDPDPRFLDAAKGDLRLRYDSPLLDLADPAPPMVTEDHGRRARSRDGDGNGSVRRDIGAHEYQRLPPKVSFQAPNALFGNAMSFTSAASDPDGDPLTAFAWTFGDGATAKGATATHTYAAPGTYQAKLTVTDATGLKSSVGRGVNVVARPGACANVQTGGIGPDRLVGLEAGDRLLGLAGDDVLSGLGGDDCLSGAGGKDTASGGLGVDRLSGGADADGLRGDAGNDRLNGGSAADRLAGGGGNDRLGGDRGNDRLVGGSGKDRLVGGSGRDRLAGDRGKDRVYGGGGNDRVRTKGGDTVSTGAGNDTIAAADGKRDRISCGKGRRDRVTADRVDRVRGCERVKRVKR